jgi:hypothetical protein
LVLSANSKTTIAVAYKFGAPRVSRGLVENGALDLQRSTVPMPEPETAPQAATGHAEAEQQMGENNLCYTIATADFRAWPP